MSRNVEELCEHGRNVLSESCKESSRVGKGSRCCGVWNGWNGENVHSARHRTGIHKPGPVPLVKYFMWYVDLCLVHMIRIGF